MHTERPIWAQVRSKFTRRLIKPVAAVAVGISALAPAQADSQGNRHVEPAVVRHSPEVKLSDLENRVFVIGISRDLSPEQILRQHSLILPGLSSDGLSPEPSEPTELVEAASDSETSVVAASSPSTPVTTLEDDSVWDQLAVCEASGDWHINTGNGFYGGLQFDLPTWQGVGGEGYPHEASREEQINRGKILKSQRGWSPWPGCRRKMGLP